LHVAFHLDVTTDEVRLQVVTAAFRKVYDRSVTGPFEAGENTLDLDLAGLRLANGLYYLVIRPSTGRSYKLKFVVLQ